MNKSQACGSSAGKESTCNAGDPTFDSWVRKIYCRKDKLPTPVFLGFSGGSDSKKSTCNAEDLGLTLSWKDSLDKGKATHSSMAWRIPWNTAHGVTKSHT